MKLVSLILAMVFAITSCTYQIPPQKLADMPGDTEVRKKESKSKPQSRQMKFNGGDFLAGAVVGAGATYLGMKAGTRKRNCNDCGSDGIVHRGDPRAIRFTFRKAYVCPACGGNGHL